jgi:hypothetical protein
MPKMIEIEEDDFNRARQTQSVVAKLLAHPKAALLVEEARKLVEPEAPTPHLDRHKEANAPLAALQKEFDDFRKKVEDDKAEGEKNTKLSALAKRVDDGNARLLSEGWTKDGIKALDEFREKEGIIDPIAAAAYYEKLHGAQVAPATPSSSIGSWDFTQPSTQDEDYTKKLLETRGESESLVMNQAMKSLSDFRGTNRR